MTRKHRRFTPQQKAEAIDLCQSEELSILAVSKRLGIHATCLGRWIRQAGIDVEGPTKKGPLSTGEWDEMNHMKVEIRELKRERNFLSWWQRTLLKSSCRRKVSLYEFTTH